MFDHHGGRLYEGQRAKGKGEVKWRRRGPGNQPDRAAGVRGEL